jgi:hypothetical protein
MKREERRKRLPQYINMFKIFIFCEESIHIKCLCASILVYTSIIHIYTYTRVTCKTINLTTNLALLPRSRIRVIFVNWYSGW